MTEKRRICGREKRSEASLRTYAILGLGQKHALFSKKEERVSVFVFNL